MNIEDLKVGDIRKIKFKTFGEDLTLKGLITQVGDHICITTDTGRKDTICRKNIIEITSTRINPEIKEYFAEITKIIKQVNKLDEKLSSLKREKYALYSEISEIEIKVVNASGAMQADDFIGYIKKNMSPYKLDLLEANGFKICATPDYISYYPSEMAIYLCKTKYIEKYANPEKFSFIYREYDNTCMISNEDKTYKELVNRYKKDLNMNNGRAFLTLGDKDWLIFVQSYKINNKERAYTKKAADLIIAELNRKQIK